MKKLLHHGIMHCRQLVPFLFKRNRSMPFAWKSLPVSDSTNQLSFHRDDVSQESYFLKKSKTILLYTQSCGNLLKVSLSVPKWSNALCFHELSPVRPCDTRKAFRLHSWCFWSPSICQRPNSCRPAPGGIRIQAPHLEVWKSQQTEAMAELLRS